MPAHLCTSRTNKFAFVILLKRAVPGSPALQPSRPRYCLDLNSWTATEIPILTHLGFSRYVDDGRPFWQHIVSSSTGCSDLQYFEELYQYYTTEKVRHSVQSNRVLAFSFLVYTTTVFAKLTRCGTFARPGVSATQTLDVFSRR